MASKKGADVNNEDQKKGSSMFKLIIIVVVAAALLGGGGFIGWKKFSGSQASDTPKVEVEKRVIFDWDPFLVNLADAGGKRYLKVTMKMEINNNAVLEEIKNRNFELKDVIIMLLSSKEFDDIATSAGKMTLKQEIISQTNRVIKQGQVREIYFTDFIIQ